MSENNKSTLTDRDMLMLCNFSGLKLELAELNAGKNDDSSTKYQTITSLYDGETAAIKLGGEAGKKARVFYKEKGEVSNSGTNNSGKEQAKTPIYNEIQELYQKSGIAWGIYKNKSRFNNITDQFEILAAFDAYGLCAWYLEEVKKLYSNKCISFTLNRTKTVNTFKGLETEIDKNGKITIAEAAKNTEKIGLLFGISVDRDNKIKISDLKDFKSSVTTVEENITYFIHKPENGLYRIEVVNDSNIGRKEEYSVNASNISILAAAGHKPNEILQLLELSNDYFNSSEINYPTRAEIEKAERNRRYISYAIMLTKMVICVYDHANTMRGNQTWKFFFKSSIKKIQTLKISNIGAGYSKQLNSIKTYWSGKLSTIVKDIGNRVVADGIGDLEDFTMSTIRDHVVNKVGEYCTSNYKSYKKVSEETGLYMVANSELVVTYLVMEELIKSGKLLYKGSAKEILAASMKVEQERFLKEIENEIENLPFISSLKIDNFDFGVSLYKKKGEKQLIVAFRNFYDPETNKKIRNDNYLFEMMYLDILNKYIKKNYPGHTVITTGYNIGGEFARLYKVLYNSECKNFFTEIVGNEINLVAYNLKDIYNLYNKDYLGNLALKMVGDGLLYMGGVIQSTAVYFILKVSLFNPVLMALLASQALVSYVINTVNAVETKKALINLYINLCKHNIIVCERSNNCPIRKGNEASSKCFALTAKANTPRVNSKFTSLLTQTRTIKIGKEDFNITLIDYLTILIELGKLGNKYKYCKSSKKWRKSF